MNNAVCLLIRYGERTTMKYVLAGLMLQNGYITEGERMIRAIRNRYDGEKRNPWNEIECGNNYARSMASYALMPIYSGFSFDMTEHFIGFAPISRTGKYFWNAADSWGMVEIDEKNCTLSVLGNPLHLASFGVPQSGKIAQVFVDSEEIAFDVKEGRIHFPFSTICKKLEIIR